MSIIDIQYRTKKLQKICNNLKEAKREIGNKAGKKLILRIVQLKAFENLQMVPTSLPWRREKLVNSEDRWSIRIDNNFRLEFIALDISENLAEIKNLKIMEVSKHYG